MTPADYSCVTKAEDLCVLSAFTIHIMYSYNYAPGPESGLSILVCTSIKLKKGRDTVL
jgi:hypothetical protein